MDDLPERMTCRSRFKTEPDISNESGSVDDSVIDPPFKLTKNIFDTIID